MLRRIVLPLIFVFLAYGFWVSPDFKEIAAGVAIFLFGMLALEEGFRAFTGGMLEKVLRRFTNGRWKSLGFGILTTTVMQSSSLVSVITISFLSAGLIDLAAGIGIVFGANLGTTTGAWLVAGFGLKVKIAAYAMPMLVFGVILVFQSSRALKGIGYVLTGLGFLFLGIHHMKEGFDSFKGAIDLAAFAVPGFAGLLLFSLIGMFATVVMQSSHATLVLIITALAAQQITYENALALAIGANVGTTITAIIGAMSANVEGRRLAAAHLIFNVTTGAIAIIAINQLVIVVEYLSHSVGIAADDYTLKLAVFHTVFNLIGIAVMMPFVGHLVRLLEKWFAAPPLELVEPRYLNDAVMSFPEAVANAVRQETLHLYDNAIEVMALSLGLDRAQIQSEQDLEDLPRPRGGIAPVDIENLYDRRVKVLYSAIVEFIGRAQVEVPASFAEQLFDLRQAARDVVEAVKDTKHLNTNLSRYIIARNPYIRAQYVGLRAHIGQVLRTLEQLRNDPEQAPSLLSLDPIKLRVEQYNQALNAKMDELIRQRHITADMASSLMNDGGYAYDVTSNLVEMGRVLFAARDRQSDDVDKTIALDPAEIESIAQKSGD